MSPAQAGPKVAGAGAGLDQPQRSELEHRLGEERGQHEQGGDRAGAVGRGG